MSSAFVEYLENTSWAGTKTSSLFSRSNPITKSRTEFLSLNDGITGSTTHQDAILCCKFLITRNMSPG